MSELIWSKTMSPSSNSPIGPKVYEIYDKGFEVSNTQSIDKTEKEIVSLPDRRAYRSMSRASVILSAVALEGIEKIKNYVDDDPFSVGIYCAINHGPEDYQCAKDLMKTSDEEFAGVYKKSRSPKHYLKQLPNLAPAQLGIFLGVMGPVNTYNHSTQGSFQAMDQAEFDLDTGKVKAALVCSAYSLEDPLLSQKTRSEAPSSSVLTEGGAAIVLAAKKGSPSYMTKLSKIQETTPVGAYFGIANPLMHLFNKEL